ncbi:hypothetical protein ACLKA7_017558 [Drosophila subpalustris]
MDTLTPNNVSSGSSNSNSSLDLGAKSAKAPQQRQRGQKLSRSRSLLQLLSKHLGRHFQHHHNETVYSSQEDIRSSSTDSFSLSYERASRLDSLDLENTSTAASYSPGMEFYDNSAHIYVQTVYQRSGSASSSSSGSGTDQENATEMKSGRSGLSSSVSRILQHFSASTASLRSLSCSSTPLRQLKTPMTKKSLTAHNNRSQSSSNNSSSNSNSSSSSCSNNSNSNSSNSSSAKKDKKQQSILRPPVQYVYMKGMSGLYSRVPSYAVCCHHMY